MLPAQDENRQISSESALANNLEVFFASKIVGSVDDLRHQLDGIELGEITGAEGQIDRIEAPLRQFENSLKIIAILIRCRVKINVAQEENVDALEQVRLEVLNRPSFANPLLGLANLITLRGIDSPAREAPAGGPRLAVRAETSELGSSSTAESLTANDDLPPTDAPSESLTSPASLQQAMDLPIHDPESPARQNDSASVAARKGLGSSQVTDDGTAEVRDTQAKTREPALQTSSDFDTDLLNDLIKNYGEFAANPNLPATLDTPRQEKEKPRLPRENKTFSAQKSHDLDRRLKKLIQEYGEYDLYSSRSGTLKTILRVGAAFVALALVLGGIYYFSAPKKVAAPPANFHQQSSAGDGAAKAREPGPGGASQTLSIQDESAQRATGLEDVNKNITTNRSNRQKGRTKP